MRREVNLPYLLEYVENYNIHFPRKLQMSFPEGDSGPFELQGEEICQARAYNRLYLSNAIAQHQDSQ